MQELYKVQMWEHEDQRDIVPSRVITIGLYSQKGGCVRSFLEPHGQWFRVHESLLNGLKELGLKFVGSLPNMDPDSEPGDKAFWIIVEKQCGDMNVT